MENLTSDAILGFLSDLGDRLAAQAKVLLLGGSALALLGSPRPTLDIDYLGDDLYKTDFQLTLERLAAQHRLDVEAVPLDRFIPLPEGASQRHIFYQRFGQLDVYILDPYAIALGKIDRGFDTDIDDVVFLVRQNLVDLDRLQAMLDAALERALEFDLNPTQARIHLDLVRRRVSSP
jgi:hypothetical protein